MKPLNKFDLLDRVHHETGEDIELLKAVMSGYYGYLQNCLSRGNHYLVEAPGLGLFFAKRKSIINKINKLNARLKLMENRPDESEYKRAVVKESTNNLIVLQALLESRDADYHKKQQVKEQRKIYEENKLNRTLEGQGADNGGDSK